jgi:hypothetical protein
LTGLDRKDLIPGSTTLTVEKFAKEMVGARSRVLHGTLSTLLGDVAAEHASLMGLARDFLLLFALELDAFAASPDAIDSRDRFLRWIDAQRALRAAAPAATPPP